MREIRSLERRALATDALRRVGVGNHLADRGVLIMHRWQIVLDREWRWWRVGDRRSRSVQVEDGVSVQVGSVKPGCDLAERAEWGRGRCEGLR